MPFLSSPGHTLLVTALAGAVLLFACHSKEEISKEIQITQEGEAVSATPDSLLRHAVYFSYTPETSKEKIEEIEAAFAKLQTSIPGIEAFEKGVNSSPEGINKGLTHAYLLTFYSNEARDAYLPHPEHVAFGELLSPHLQDVMVIDYWTSTN